MVTASTRRFTRLEDGKHGRSQGEALEPPLAIELESPKVDNYFT